MRAQRLPGIDFCDIPTRLLGKHELDLVGQVFGRAVMALLDVPRLANEPVTSQSLNSLGDDCPVR